MRAEGKDSFILYLPSAVWDKNSVFVGITPFRCPVPLTALSHAAEHYEKNKMKLFWDCFRATLESVRDGI